MLCGDLMRFDVMMSLVLFSLPGQTALAQDQNDSARKLREFTNTPDYSKYILQVFSALPDSVFQRCPALKSSGSQVTILKPVSFAASGWPNGGMWKQQFPVSGCGNDTIWTVYVAANADEKLRSTIALPGTTRADLVLQHDALVYANIAAQQAVKDCKAFVVKNTRFESFGTLEPKTEDPGPAARFRPWWETWTLTGCGKTVDVPLDFIPDGKGTTITQQPDRAVVQ